MELIATNLAGNVRQETLHGRAYLVAPATLIVPGILNGSDGPLLYPEDETARDPSIWNGVPMVVGHPMKDGKPVSARDPQILADNGIGTFYNTGYAGKLQSEAWFDIETTKAYDKQHKTDIYGKASRGEKIELSTGLHVRKEKVPGTLNGTEYKAIARDYRPDHVAVILDGKGACSVKDGCGIHNELIINPPSWVEDEDIWQRAKDAAAKNYEVGTDTYWAVVATIYEKMGGKRKTANCGGPGGTPGPCAGGSQKIQLHKQIAEYHRQSAMVHQKAGRKAEYQMHMKAAKFHEKRAAKYLTRNPAGDSNVDKTKTVNSLVTNCPKLKGQEKLLETLTDEQLSELLGNAELMGKVKAGVKIGGTTLVFNSEKSEFESKGGTNVDPLAGKSFTEILNERGTPAEKAAWDAAVRVERNERIRLVTLLVANLKDSEKRKAKGKELMKHTVPELESLLELMPPAPVANTTTKDEELDFSGAAGSQDGVTRNRSDLPKLPQPRVDWAAIAALRSRERANN